MTDGRINLRMKIAAAAAGAVDFILLYALNGRLSTPNASLLAGILAGAAAALLVLRTVRRPALPLLALLPPLLTAGALALYQRHYSGLPLIAIFAAAASGAVAVQIILAIFRRDLPDERYQERMLKGIIGASLGLRLINLGFPDLLAEEAYYWKYAENLSPGYLDHPPFVAVLIRIGTIIFGPTELGVRIGAFFCLLGCGYFVSRFAAMLFGRRTVLPSLAMLFTLPYFFGTGFFITPDSPLLLCWAGALYFVARAVLQGRQLDWYAAGIFFGFGMLGKYPMALFGFAAVVYLLSCRNGRRAFFSPHPYLALLLALLIFSPVLYWNSQNGWASFMFQGPARLEEKSGFYLHVLLLHLLFVLTPAGLVSFYDVLRNRIKGRAAQPSQEDLHRRLCLFFAVVPVLVFLVFSLRHEPKINWTGPAFLSLLPVFSALLLDAPKLRRAWNWTFAVLLVAYGVLFHFFSLGLPGIRPGDRMRKFAGWEDLAAQIDATAVKAQETFGQSPLVVGMDKHYVASELGFYRAKLAFLAGRPLPEKSLGRRLFGRFSLMYDFWSRPGEVEGRAMILVSRTRSDLDDEVVRPYFSLLAPILELHAHYHGSEVGTYYYRLGVGYHSKP